MSEEIHATVREKYGSVAGSGLSGNHAGVKAVAQAFGYSADELKSIPAEANMGLSCGNPTAFASLRAGEVVVDLGSAYAQVEGQAACCSPAVVGDGTLPVVSSCEALLH